MFRAPYLNDANFLKEFDKEKHKEHFIRISVLHFNNEAEIAKIEGKATGGSVNLSGNSATRRTMSCSLIVDPNGIQMEGYSQNQYYANITEVENLISLNKKVRVEVGLVNTLANLGKDWYPEYEILWFPLGTFVVKAASVSRNNNGINISLTLNDKSALLNGDMGGTLPAAIVFSESELYNATGTQREIEQVLIIDIIKKLVIDFGGESPDRVLIEDIPENIVKVMKWTGKDPVYLYLTEGKKTLQLTKPENGMEGIDWLKFIYGQDIGYTNEPFVYPGTLECKAGDSVATMLNKIKDTLGNYEWFYDINGFFHFREIRSYINTSFAKSILELKENDYLSVSNLVESIYAFDEDNKALITSVSNAPQYQNIKNDYIIWGTMKTATGADKPIRYHLAFDTKPKIDINKMRKGIVFKNYNGVEQFQPLIEEQYVYILDKAENLQLREKCYYLKRDWR